MCYTNWLFARVGSILDFSFDIDIDTGQKTSDSISIFSISVESVKIKIQWMSEKKDLAVGKVNGCHNPSMLFVSYCV